VLSHINFDERIGVADEAPFPLLALNRLRRRRTLTEGSRLLRCAFIPSRLAQARADGGPRQLGRIGRCSGPSGIGREPVS